MNIKVIRLEFDPNMEFWAGSGDDAGVRLCDKVLSRFLPVFSDGKSVMLTVCNESPALPDFHHGRLLNKSSYWSIVINGTEYVFGNIPKLNVFLTKWVMQNETHVWFKVEVV